MAYFLAKDMMPSNIALKPGFTHVLNKMAPHYNTPSQAYFSDEEIPLMYENCHTTVQMKVSDRDWFSATTDLWISSSGGGEPYISLTIHHIFSDWKLMSHCLETIYFPEDHRHAHIIEIMTENILQAWKITRENIVCFTTDTASSMRKAFTEGQSLWIWLGCLGHNLNLAFSNTLGIQRVQTAVKACRHLLEAFHEAGRRNGASKKAEMGLPKHALIHDVVTR